jgi:hypothetical protein
MGWGDWGGIGFDSRSRVELMLLEHERVGIR